MPNFPDEEQGPSGSAGNQKRDDKEGEDRRPEEPMQQDPDPAGKYDKASTGGLFGLDFNLLDDFEIETKTLEGTTEPAEDETSTLEHPSACMNLSLNLPDSSSPAKLKKNEIKLSLVSPRRKKLEGTARVLFLGTLSEEEWAS